MEDGQEMQDVEREQLFCSGEENNCDFYKM